jgi:hypothetical protein
VQAGEFLSDEGDKRLRDRFFGKIALPEDRQDSVNAGTGRLPEDVIPLDLSNVLVN